jgi:glucokinase
VQRTARYLGLGVANLVTLFTPDTIALGGGLMRSLSLFWPQIRAAVRENCGYVPHEKVRIVPAALGDDVGIIGAACAWVLRYESESS